MFSRPAVAQKQTIAESTFASFPKLQNPQKISPEIFANRRHTAAGRFDYVETHGLRPCRRLRRRACGRLPCKNPTFRPTKKLPPKPLHRGFFFSPPGAEIPLKNPKTK